MFHIHLGEKWVFIRFTGLILLLVAFVLLIQTPLCLKCFWRDLALSLYDSSIHENLQSAATLHSLPVILKSSLECNPNRVLMVSL